MATLRVKTRLGKKEVVRRFSSLPKIIAGEAPDPLGLRRLFFAVFARRLYELIYAAYKVKATGGTDSLGNTWRGLKPKTIQNRLRPSFVAKYPLSAKLLINRVTDRLLESFRPGKISGNNYIPQSEQKYLLQINQLILGSEVPYSSKVHKARRLWPARMKPWIQEATNRGVDACVVRLAESLA